MDAKEVKAALKSAREAIRLKDYKEALRHCKGILKHDKNNYNALVFVGVAALGMEQTDQAIMAYKRAVDTNPDQVLAWQGICDLYEKQNKPEYHADLAQTYEKLIEFYAGDFVKTAEMSMKLADLYCSLSQTDKAVEIYLKFSVGETESAVQANKKLVAVLSRVKSHTEAQRTQLEEAYGRLLKQWTHGGDELIQKWKDYVNFLRQNCAGQHKLVSACEEMMGSCSDHVFPFEILCQLHIDNYVTGHSDASEKIQKYCGMLQELDNTSPVLTLTRGVMKLMQKEYLDACKLLNEGVLLLPRLVSGWTLLARSQSGVHDIHGAAESIRQGWQALQRKDRILSVEASVLSRELKLTESKILCGSQTQQDVRKAVELCENMLADDSTDRSVLFIMAEAFLNLAEQSPQPSDESCSYLQQAAQTVKKLEDALGQDDQVMAVSGWYNYLNGDPEAAEKSLQQAIELCAGVGKYHYWLARVYWTKSQSEESCTSKFFSSMLQAAKLDPYHSNTFLYLGYYYSRIVKDNEKARRCYQKAFDLDKDNDQAGAALVDTLTALGNVDKVNQILTQVTSQASAGSAKWAWLRLGLHQVNHGDPTQAITSLQCALRADPTDMNCWECLGEGYMSRGSYTAALKAFTRAAELSQENMYSLYQISKIKHVLCHYTEAVVDYKIILEKTPDYVPALTGIGETYLNLAKSSLSQFFHGRAVDQCQLALSYLTRAASQRPDLSCVWKLMGDACTLLHNLDSSLVRMNVPAKLLTSDQKATDRCVLGKADMLALGTRCYGGCLKLAPDGAHSWHDLGLSYFYQSQNATDKAAAKSFVSNAVSALKKAITLDPKTHVYWNTLGTVTASNEYSNPALAQHCFIKSTQLEPNSVSAWTNLGALYLKHENIKLAHEAFKTAQSLEPSYVISWIGQALIAETVGHDEAMDLFRHTTELANHSESCLGYGHWVCSVMRSLANRNTDYYRYAIEQMSAVPVACDALARYTDRVQNDQTAWNMYGLLLERQKLHRQATKAFAKAVDLLSDTENMDLLNKARANLARSLCTTGQYEESVKQYLHISPLTEFEDICGLGMAQYKLDNLKESFQAYEQALEIAPSTQDRSHVYTALAMVAYKYRDAEGAKTSLFKASQMSPPSVEGLLALCSLGWMQGDMTLISAVMAELLRFGDMPDYQRDVVFMSSLLYQLQGNLLQSRNHVCKAIHNHPDSASLWGLLAKNLHSNSPGSATSTALCAEIARAGKNEDEELARLTAISSVGVGMSLSWQQHRSVFNNAKKCVHLFPDKLQNWCVLLAAGQAEQIVNMALNKKCSPSVVSLSSHLLSRVEEELQKSPSDSTQLLHLWCAKQYSVSLLSTDRPKEAQQFLTMAEKLFSSTSDSSPSMKQLLAFLQRDVPMLKSLIKSGESESIQLLVEMLEKEGSLAEAVSLVQEQLCQAVSHSHRIQLLIQLTYLAFRQLQIDGADVWKEMCAEVVKKTLDAAPSCSTSIFLQVSLAAHQANTRLLRHSLEKLLSCPLDGINNWQRQTARRLLLPIYQEKGNSAAVKDLLVEAKEEGQTDLVLDNTN